MGDENNELLKVVDPSEEMAMTLARIYTNLNSNDQELIDQSEKQLDIIFQDDVIGLVVNSATLINTDELEKSVYYWAIFAIRKVFTPTGSLTREMISTVWIKSVSPDTRDFVKAAVIRTLLFPDEQVVGMGTIAYANLFATENIYMCQLTEDALFSIFRDQSNQYTILSRIGALKTLQEIFDPRIIKELAYKFVEVQDFLSNCCTFLKEEFISILSFTTDIAIEICRTSSFLVRVAKLPFSEHYLDFLNAIPSILSNCSDENLYEGIHDFILSIAIELYEFPELNFQKIIELTATGVLECQIPNFIALSVKFWVYFAKFECNVLKKYNNYLRFIRYKTEQEAGIISDTDREIIYRSICKNYIVSNDSFLQRVLFLLTIVNPDDTEPESLEIHQTKKYEPHMYASICLDNLFQLAPLEVLKAVEAFWESYFDTTNWTIIHALILTIHSVCKIPLQKPKFAADEKYVYDAPDYINSKLSCVANFLNRDEVALRLYNIISESTNLRLVDSTLYTISLAIKEYNLFMKIDFLPELYQVIAQWATHESTILSLRAINVVISTINRMNTVQHQNYIQTNFDNYLIFAYQAIERKDALFDNLYLSAFQILNLIIEKSPDMCINDVTEKILRPSIDFIKRSSTELFIISDEYAFAKQQQYINLITTCFKRYKNDLIDYQQEVLDSLFQLMKNKNQIEIHEESLNAIITIISRVPDQAYHVINIIFDYVEPALASQNSTIITYTILALSFLYDSVLKNPNNENSIILYSYLPKIFSLIVDEILNPENEVYITKDNLAYILQALSFIITAAKTKINDVDRDKLYTVYTRYIEIPLCIDEDEDPDFSYPNLLFTSIFKGFASLIPLYENLLDDKNVAKSFMRQLMKQRIKPYLSFPNYTIQSLNAFFDLLEQFNSIFGKSGNVFLNLRSNFKILLSAMSLGDKNLLDRAKYLWKIIRSA